jgi:hypothetical protein
VSSEGDIDEYCEDTEAEKNDRNSVYGETCEVESRLQTSRRKLT